MLEAMSIGEQVVRDGIRTDWLVEAAEALQRALDASGRDPDEQVGAVADAAYATRAAFASFEFEFEKISVRHPSGRFPRVPAVLAELIRVLWEHEVEVTGWDVGHRRTLGAVGDGHCRLRFEDMFSLRPFLDAVYRSTLRRRILDREDPNRWEIRLVPSGTHQGIQYSPEVLFDESDVPCMLEAASMIRSAT